MVTVDTFEEFVNLYKSKVKTEPGYLRKGQILMNTLQQVNPEEYNNIISHYYDEDYDCFYDDNKITQTLKHLENAWE